MFWRKPAVVESPTTQKILELLEKQQVSISSTPTGFGLLSGKNLNALVIAAIIGITAFIWNQVTEQPSKNAEQSSQIAEIRTTVLGLKNDFADIKSSLADNKKDTASIKSQVDTTAAEIDALKRNVQTDSDRITQLEKDTR